MNSDLNWGCLLAIFFVVMFWTVIFLLLGSL